MSQANCLGGLGGYTWRVEECGECGEAWGSETRTNMLNAESISKGKSLNLPKPPPHTLQALM